MTVLVLTAAPGAAQTFSDADTDVGVLWRGASPELAVQDIAALAAPILWYSRDEPLLLTGGVPIPEAHPCDVSSAGPVVYYQVLQIKHRGEPVDQPVEDDPRFFEKVESFVLKYFFYYREDSGVGGHPHDLEAAEFEIYLDQHPDGYQVRLASVTALAHGSRWYANILEIQADTAFPVALFVEEGKHATAPDRNGDGHYTPGYDVTRRVNDAWGVRDTLGSGVLLTAAYAAAMTKPRHYEDRLLPPETALLHAEPRNLRGDRGQQSLGRYELRAAGPVSVCDEIPVERDRLVSMMRYHRFGAAHEPPQYGPHDIRGTLRQLGEPDAGWLPSLSYREERGPGISSVFLPVDVGLGWVALKLNVNTTSASLGALYTPSASRFADYYVAGGLNRIFKTTTLDAQVQTEEGRVDVTFAVDPRWDPYLEGGVRFRVNVSGAARWFTYGHRFAGVRVGIRTLGISDFFDTRIIFEVGAGAF